MPDFTINREKAGQHLVAIRNLWRRREYWLKESDPPEVMFHPEGVEVGSRFHAHYLLFVAYLSRSGKTANQVIKLGGRIARDFPDLIDPGCHMFSHDDRAVDVLAEAMIFEQYERSLGWIRNMRYIYDRYDGDIFKIFTGLNVGKSKESVMSSRKELIKRFDDLWGIGHKIAQLAIAWFQIVDWPTRSSIWRQIRRIPIVAIDVHALRLVKQFGWVEHYETDKWDKLAEPISDILSEIMFDLGFNYKDWHDAAQGMWHIQARHCNCYRRCKSEAAARRRCLNSCPAVTLCQGLVPAGGRDERHRRTMFWDKFEEHPSSDYQPPLIEVPFVATKKKTKGSQSSKQKNRSDDCLNQTSLPFSDYLSAEA